MNTKLLYLLLVFLAWALPGAAAASARGPAVFQTRGKPAALLELYTSEGCSSCPPAETWLSRLTNSSRLWNDFVPIAFHVDYWNNKAWRDPWSSKEFSLRQWAYVASWNEQWYYTPEFLLNGKEWRDWRKSVDGPQSWRPAAGMLSLTSENCRQWHVRFVPFDTKQGALEIHAAVLAFGNVSDVTGGENKGRRLWHDFVVTTLTSAPLNNGAGQRTGEFSFADASVDAGRKALAAWVTRAGTLQPLQAVGGWLPPERLAP